jgi:hypothetical protein
MGRTKSRLTVSWIVGILTFVALDSLKVFFTDALGIVTYVDFGELVTFENRYYEEELSGVATGIGYSLMIVSIMFAVRVGMAVYKSDWRGGVSQKGEVDFSTCIYGLITYSILAYMLDIGFGYKNGFHQTVRNIVEFSLTAGLVYLLFQWRNIRISRLRSTSDQTGQEL